MNRYFKLIDTVYFFNGSNRTVWSYTVTEYGIFMSFFKYTEERFETEMEFMSHSNREIPPSEITAEVFTSFYNELIAKVENPDGFKEVENNFDDLIKKYNLKLKKIKLVK